MKRRMGTELKKTETEKTYHFKENRKKPKPQTELISTEISFLRALYRGTFRDVVEIKLQIQIKHIFQNTIYFENELIHYQIHRTNWPSDTALFQFRPSCN